MTASSDAPVRRVAEFATRKVQPVALVVLNLQKRLSTTFVAMVYADSDDIALRLWRMRFPLARMTFYACSRATYKSFWIVLLFRPARFGVMVRLQQALRAGLIL